MSQRTHLIPKFFIAASLSMSAMAFLSGCASEPKRVSIPASANANEELATLQKDLAAAQENHVDILAPQNFRKAQKSFKEAGELREKNKSNKDVVQEIGQAKAYLNLATAHADSVRPSAMDILKARSEAQSSGAAQLLPKQFSAADKEFKESAADAEDDHKSIEADERAELQKAFFDVQSEALKTAQLDPVESAIANARKNGASRFAPQSLASAEAKLQAATNIIETDRNNTTAINETSLAAREQATKLVQVTSIARKNKVSETVALELYSRRANAAAMDANAVAMNKEMNATETLLQEERDASGRVRQKNASLEKDKQFNEAFAWAQQQFNRNEAEVYRQGDQLLIRLKAMNYKSGQTELPAAAYPVLGKVKEVIERMGVEKVRVEGHTDSTGSATINQTLSQARADGVAQYLADEKLISKNQVEAEGLGLSKPISTNSTSKGRSQNRRVDIILTPGETTEPSAVR